MKPDRSNYEIWFTDWFDGNLGEEQVEELKVFLDKNPDLQEELDNLAFIRLKPSETKFKGKKDLVRSDENLSDSQFDHLCIANLENDLAPLQQAELKEIIDRDEARKKRFELIQRLKLDPPSYTFMGKSILKKLTTGQKIIRLSVIGLSTAAAVVLAVAAYLSVNKNINKGLQLISLDLTYDTLYIESHTPLTVKKNAGNTETGTFISESAKYITESIVSTEQIAPSEPVLSGLTAEIIRSESLPLLHVPIPGNMFTAKRPSTNVLIAYVPPYIPPLFDDNRSNVDRFLARFFHEKIMRDTISADRPVKTFDVALAGINGLNKLFGWEMALHKNIDENGMTRSYYFSSKLLKINAPVKKTINAL
jgi:hypothetical protein